MAGERRDPYRNFRFRIEVEGIQQAGFSEISGFDASLSVIEYREGNETITPRKLPGLAKYGNISLKWGVTDSMDMYNWMSESIQGKVSRKTVTIIAINEEGGDVATWQVIEAWPSKYSAPSFKGTGNEVAIESLELAHEGMTRTK
ncbi:MULTISPECIES: phage tail protein [Paenibacillus]|uniref:Phage tail protein n=3 Tax=Paenibacillus TaxID=44249 RepID=A0ABU3RET8_9BACL|nr:MULTISPECIES: phage tail protein [Paenibacillus]MBA2942945.1 phage tail protein [Paenibacillus sp. CGMCC 1.16610]MCY9662624.1 phage tail protein [Paenibacillus anseongense]MDU0202751.1 phage tail protein [Paenibacillus sp. PFR10]MEB4793572.1 phage tail protein [Paenibacillus chondroitinus]MEC0267494.1 phage tail protein [Paenibacillus anseongense]